MEKEKNKKDVMSASRMGRKPILLPEGIKASVQEGQVHVEGKKGRLAVTLPALISACVKDKNIVVETKGPLSGYVKALHGLSRKLIFNMVDGVQNGFSKKIIVEGIGIRTQIAGDKLTLTLGFSHPVVYKIPKGITITADPKKQSILTIQGVDKQLVGQAAADIRKVKTPEPYKGTGIRYENEIIRRKAGKSAVGAAAPGGAKK